MGLASITPNDSAKFELGGKIMMSAIILLFLVVIFVMFLHMYAKWFWWRVEEDQSHAPPYATTRRRFDFAPGRDPIHHGLDLAVIRSLPVLIYRSDEFKVGLECAVCLCEVVDGEEARMLPKCDHGFHVECIDMWFQSHSTCPLCRNSITSPDSSIISTDSSSLELSDSSLESPNFPTNVLFWGNQTQVSSGASSLEEGPSSQTSSSSSNRSPQDGMMVIDIPRGMDVDEEVKLPMPTRLRSLKRLLSREKRVVACSPSSVDVEQTQF